MLRNALVGLAMVAAVWGCSSSANDRALPGGQTTGGGGGNLSAGVGGGSDASSTSSATTNVHPPDAHSQPKADLQCADGADEHDYAFGIPDARNYGSADYVASLVHEVKGMEPGAHWPEPSQVHAVDFVSTYYAPAYGGNAPGATALNVKVMAAPIAIASQTFVQVQVEVTAPRRIKPLPAHVDIIVDTSPSMTGAPISRAAAAVRAIHDHYQAPNNVPGSTVVNVVPTSSGVVAPFDDSKLDALLTPGPGATLARAIEASYADIASDGTGLRPIVVVISDGGAPVGSIPQIIADQAAAVSFVAVGVADPDITHEAFLRTAASQGRGSYVYLGGATDPHMMLDTRFEEISDVFVRNVSLAISMPPAYYLTTIDPNAYQSGTLTVGGSDLGPGATMVFRHVIEQCASDMASLDSDLFQFNVSYDDENGLPATLPTISTALPSVFVPSFPNPIAEVAILSDFAEAVRGVDGKRLARIQSDSYFSLSNAGKIIGPQIDVLLKLNP